MGNLQDAARLLKPAVADTIAALDLKPEDTAAAVLARRYAKAIDDGDGDALSWLGPKLLAVLEQLGATPAARAKLKGRPAPDGKPNRLSQLRDARRA